jgi:Domain of Unknown Function (DUF1080)
MRRIGLRVPPGRNRARLTAVTALGDTFAGAVEFPWLYRRLRIHDNDTQEEKMMTGRRTFLIAGIAILGAGIAGCAGSGAEGGWVTLLDGSRPSSIDGWTQIGEGNWSFVDGTLQGKNGKAGFMVSKDSYTDFEVRAEFWADEDANSGIFLRCQDRNKVGSATAYEVNIFDKRPDPSYGTGAIVDVAKVAQPGPKAANRWNTYEITARGERMVVVLNGQQTADGHDSRRHSGPIALQSAAGTIRFRKVQIRTM